MKIIGFIIFGMIVSIMLLAFGEIGIVLLGGAIFGILFYIADTISNKNNKRS